MMAKLKLTINEDKTHMRILPQERFDFLGYTFGRCYRHDTGRAYIGERPSRKSIKRIVSNITQETHRSRRYMEVELIVDSLNRKLEGWANYFCLGQVTPAYKAVNIHTIRRLR